MTESITSEILRPGEVGYDQARTVWNAMVDRHPALIVRCREVSDVVGAIALARREGLEIGIRCGGHSVVGHSVPEAGLMIDLTFMAQVRVDPEQRRARVQGGALLGALDAASQEHGLAVTAGNVSHTGVGGLTLGGGMGWLARQPVLAGLPVLANVDFGHTNPLATLPIGGRAQVIASATPRLRILEH